MHQQVTAFQNFVAHAAGVETVVGVPNQGNLGKDVVVVWPWRMEVNSGLKSLPQDKSACEGFPATIVHCLVWAFNLQILDRVQSALNSSPLIIEADFQTQVLPEALSNEDLIGVFSAARLSPWVCLPYVLHSVSAYPPASD
jgi:hypothetical protein